MIRSILHKEYLEYRRNGRVASVAAVTAILLVTALVTGWAFVTDQRTQAEQAQRRDQAAFTHQGERNPHAAAHFGRMAYKALPPLALFDSGTSQYLGQVIWLEAHTRSFAMFRPAEDAPELSRLADLSVAGVMALLVPLLLFLVGGSSLAAERAQGTLQQVVGTGVEIRSLFVGKLAAVAGMGVAVSVTVIALCAVVAIGVSGGHDPFDTALRAAALSVGYGLYSVSFAAIALIVSSRSRRPAVAHLILLGLWAVTVVVLPRVGARVAGQVFPTPDKGTFWSGLRQTIEDQRPKRDSQAYRAVEASVLTRAFGREVQVAEVSSTSVDRAGLRLSVSEALGNRGHDAVFTELFATYDAQRWVRRIFALASPAIALRHFSEVISGTDVLAHRHFADDAERQRNRIVRALNEDLLLNGAGKGFSYLAGDELWSAIPDFSSDPPRALQAMWSCLFDLAVLAIWAAIATAVAWRSVVGALRGGAIR